MEDQEKTQQQEQEMQETQETQENVIKSIPLDEYENTNKNEKTQDGLTKNRTSPPEAKKQKMLPLQIIGGVLIVAVIVLYILHFQQPQSLKPIPVRTGDSSHALIVTVNTDSVTEHFVLVKLLKNDLEKETETYQKELQTKSSAFESKYQNYMINVQNNVLTQTQMQNAEKQLMQEKELLEALSDRYTKILVDKEMSVQNEIMDSLKNATKRVNEAGYHADYIFATNSGSAILHASEWLDITDQVIKELNDSYKK
ncbi:MAG: OmpH family outer membrane protein [Bacteroidales bacterium]|jgi:outer membrane protein|nr:OmpH family outer membrane protein [Bacteroidales bacterium]